MRSASTNLARSLGYLSAPSVEKVTYTTQNVTVVGPSSCEVRSYHDGLSSKEAFLSARALAKEAGLSTRRAICRRLEFRL